MLNSGWCEANPFLFWRELYYIRYKNSLLITCNLSHTVHVALDLKWLRVAVDNISVDNTRQSSSSVSPIANGQSDHDVVHLTINITAVITILWGWSTSKTNYETIMHFQLLLKNSTLKSLCNSRDLNSRSTSFLNAAFFFFLNICAACFTIKYINKSAVVQISLNKM